MKDEGKALVAIYAVKKIRDSLPVKPVYLYNSTHEKDQETYISFISYMRNMTQKIQAASDLSKIPSYLEDEGYVKKINSYHYSAEPKAGGCVNTKILRTFHSLNDVRALEAEREKKQFLFTEDEKILSGILF